MNMPVLPVASSNPPPADVPARGADAATTTDAPAFSNVLSQQRDGVAARPAESRRTENAGGRANPDTAERPEPLGPDETLSLILDSAALPLMQAAVAVETRPDRAGATTDADTGTAIRTAADPRAARLPIDVQGQAPAEPRDGAPVLDTRTAEADANGRNRAPRLDVAAATAPATARTTLQTDTAAPANPRESGRARLAATQSQSQTTGQASLAQAAAGSRAADPSTQDRPAAGLATLQAATPDAALASAAAPTGASLLPAAAPMPATAPVAVSTPLSNPQWPQDFSRQILHLTQNLAGAGGTVQMHVNPPELGPIHITLHVGDSIAQASFVSPHASVRQALENALPHLEQQLAQAGLSLGQADVGDQQPGQQAQGQAHSTRNGESTFSLDGQTADATAQPAAPMAPRTVSRPDALVDTFA
jgi:flagellar hook-length control protein FliK